MLISQFVGHVVFDSDDGRSLLMPGARQRLDGEEILVHRAHVDVPGFALVGLVAGQLAYVGEPALDVDAGGGDDKLAVKGIDRDLGVGHRAIAAGHVIDLRLPQAAGAIVAVHVWVEPISEST